MGFFDQHRTGRSGRAKFALARVAAHDRLPGIVLVLAVALMWFVALATTLGGNVIGIDYDPVLAGKSALAKGAASFHTAGGAAKSDAACFGTPSSGPATMVPTHRDAVVRLKAREEGRVSCFPRRT